MPFSLDQVQGWLNCFAPRHLALLIREADSPAPLTLLFALAMLLWPGACLTPAELRLYGLNLRRSRAAGGGSGSAAAYIGEAAWTVRCWRLNRGAIGLLNDKLMLSYLLAGSRLGAPRTLAYLGVPAPLLPVPALEGTFELVDFLRQATYPLFLKPLEGSQGKGCLAIEALVDGELRLGNGQRLPLDQAAVALRRQLGGRALVQERLVPHSLLRPVCGDTCATVRLLSSCDGDRVSVVAAVLKLPIAGAMVDNLHAANNRRPVSLAPVNPANGTLGPWRRFNGCSSEPVAPPLPLEEIPDWAGCLSIVHSLHPLDRRAVLLGWDVAISEGGPMVVEANGSPSIQLLQLATGRGFRDADGQRLLARLEASARR